MFDDFKKFDKEFNESMNISLEGNKKKKKFPNPKPRYTKQNQQQKKNKPIMTKENQDQAKKIIKETGSAFGSLLSKLKNRKIRKLEKEHFKQKEKAEALAHEIKLRLSIQDSNVDISRYEKELEILNKPKDVNHSQACIEYNDLINGEYEKCICGNEKE